MTDTSAAAPAPASPPVDTIGTSVPLVLEALATRDVVFLARDEPHGAEMAHALAAGAPDALVVFCPGSDALPGDSAPASHANVGLRGSALRKLRAALSQADRPRIAMVSTGEAAARLYPAPEAFDSAPPTLRKGEPRTLEALAAELEDVGYTPDDRVDEPGEVAVRGQVIDIFPADSGAPFRIEIHDGTILSIRPYDPLTQLTTGEADMLEVGRATEPEIGEGTPLLNHLPGAALAIEAGAEDRRRRFLALAADAQKRRPKRAVTDICTDARWRTATKGREVLAPETPPSPPIPRFVEQKNPSRAFARFAKAEWDAGNRIVLLGTARDLRFLARQSGRLLKREAVHAASWAEVAASDAPLLCLAMPLPHGFRHGNLVAVSAADLLGSRAQREAGDAAIADNALFRMGEIKNGDVVVHEDHGLGVVAGLEALPTGGDAIVLRFAGDARRLLPVGEAHKLWRYGAEADAVTLDKLDGSTWAKRRGEIDAAIAQSARDLVRIAEERLAQHAPELIPEPAAYERFSSGFAFSETPDQGRAIAAVRSDLASGKPMDRLVIGDVGYGKTEVALRAAALTALAGKQVVLAAPTTVLVRQHLETFAQRFEEAGIEVAGLSRLSTAADRKRVRAGLADGSIRVVVGTGAVAGKEVDYHDLGLVIIDEEQRFGAADKAKLRGLGAHHVLTLSATPIPRTLQQALVGLQQMSVIATPPARRQPIRTTVAELDEQSFRTALIRERSRGGQSFVVVPRIEDMAAMRARLDKLVPELELLEAHGKMPAAEIDEAMVRFARGDGDVLLATNIIEAGLDVPRANTMIVWRADRFGLSQLHQLRGRVGRGARRGQIYLLTEPGAAIAPRTLSRLQTLQAFDRLGAGFAISARDLDMRGAGELLGEEQTGHVKLIGVDLYQHLLGHAVRVARGEAADSWTPTLNIGAEGRLPESWIPDEDQRISLYARLARIEDLDGLDSFEHELIDRFGEAPEEAQRLLALARLRLLAHSANVEKLDAGPAAIALTPKHGAPFDAGGTDLHEKNGRWLLSGQFDTDHARVAAAEGLLDALTG